MIVRMMDNTCVICGQIIPEGRQVCPICGTTDADIFGKLMGKPASEEEFKVDDELEQAFHQGFEAGMKHACSVCGEEWHLEDGTPQQNNMNFCPRCGSRMDGDADA